MKLDVNLDQLWSRVKQMGAEPVDFSLTEIWRDTEIEFDVRLGTSGVVISLEDLEYEQGLLSVKGRQVLLFIPDQGIRIAETLADPSKGRKFHVMDCTTLIEMRANNRFERYTVTNSLKGSFSVYGITKEKQEMKGIARLNVCKNCMKELNYKGYTNLTNSMRNELVTLFNFEEFFSTYSSLFKHVPAKHAEGVEGGYSNDWAKISSALRQDKEFTCQHCTVNLSSNKSLLHVHHKNGVKNDNKLSNLIVLCADCHRKEPFHQHMFVKHSDSQLINSLRKEQNLLQNNDWATVFKHADTAVFCVLDHCRNNHQPVPVVGYELKDNSGTVITLLELAWPNIKIGVSIGNRITVPGWRVMNLREALLHFG